MKAGHSSRLLLVLTLIPAGLWCGYLLIAGRRSSGWAADRHDADDPQAVPGAPAVTLETRMPESAALAPGDLP